MSNDQIEDRSMKNKLPEIQLIVSLIVSISLMIMVYKNNKLEESSKEQYARLSSIAYQSLNKLDKEILNEFILMEKDGLTAEEIGKINSIIINKNIQ